MGTTLKLLKFIVKSRVSSTMLAILLIVIIYAIFSGIEMAKSGIRIETKVPQYYAVAYATFFIVFSAFSGGLAILKSDRDYLFMLPIKRNQLIFTLFIGQIIVLGTAVMAFLGFYLPFLGLNAWEAALSFILFILFVTSLSTFVGDLPTMRKSFVAIMLAIWGIIPFAAIPYSPTAMFFGHPIYGILTLLPTTCVTMYFTIRKLGNINIEYSRNMAKESSTDYKKILSFSRLKGLKALYYLNIFYVMLSGRSGGMGYGIRYFSGRIKLTNMVLIISILSAVYVLLIYRFFILDAGFAGIIVSIFFVSFIYSFVQSSIVNERPWLVFTSMDPGKYLIHLSISKAITTFILVLPLAIANIILQFLGGKGAISQSVLLIIMPSIMIISYYIAAKFTLLPQMREEGIMPGQMRARQMFYVIPIYILIAILSISLYNLVWGLIASLIILIMAGLLLLNVKGWRDAAFSLVDHGYI
ncbi:MAG: hypothetical protein C0171_04655 [Caldisphaera sp.]|nr:MAG: hypothetical protein C0171_04655 [Caldisphaera sp.]